MNTMRRWMVGLMLLVSATSSGLSADWPAGERASEYQLKSAFVYNLMAFVEWPHGALANRIVVGFAGEGPMEAALAAFLKNKNLGRFAIEVRGVHARNDLRACNVLYLAYPDTTRMRDALAQVRDVSVLTIGDGEEFVRMGGVIGLVPQQKNLRLVVNPVAALPNRRLFADRLSQALAAAQRQQSRVALIYMDLDGFKLVNDTLGHSTGDLLLREVADRLRRRIRASDTFARIGGDEFTVVATSIRNARDAGLIANAMLAEFERPFVIKGDELVLTASIGISLYPDDALHAEQIVQQADTAMYVAKSAGKNQATFFTRQYGEVVRERVELEKQLRGALERGDLTAHYQPEFDVATHRLLRFESLARWRHPTLGMIPPLKFIPIAEENGLIVPIGKWMMEQACIAAVRWQRLSEHPVGVAVNVTTTQFLQNEFVEMVGGILHTTGLHPGLLQLELTESVLMPGHGDSLEKLARLRALGISLAMDDFGTGYSSLSYLSRLPFDHLKIDRSFLEQIVASKERQTMMRSVVELAHNLKMTVIIEGVETPEQYALIRSFGCDEVQGFLFGRPTANPDQYLLKNAAIYKNRAGRLANSPAGDPDSRAAPRPENAIAEVP